MRMKGDPLSYKDVQGIYRGHIRIMWGYNSGFEGTGSRDITPRMENHMEKKMQDEMEAGVMFAEIFNVGLERRRTGNLRGCCWRALPRSIPCSFG